MTDAQRDDIVFAARIYADAAASATDGGIDEVIAEFRCAAQVEQNPDGRRALNAMVVLLEKCRDADA